MTKQFTKVWVAFMLQPNSPRESGEGEREGEGERRRWREGMRGGERERKGEREGGRQGGKEGQKQRVKVEHNHSVLCTYIVYLLFLHTLTKQSTRVGGGGGAFTL